MSTPEDSEAAFIGKITASATHELRNVLAIVKESAGLIEDIVVASAERGSANPDRVMRAVDRIRAQVTRGSDLLTNLNRFAHSPDRAEEEIDLNQAVDQVPFLCQRAARRGRHELQVQHGGEDVRVVANALRLQMVLHAAVECCLEQLPEGGTLALRPVRQGNRPALEFNGESEAGAVGLAPTEAAAWDQLAAGLNDLKGSVEKGDAGEGFRLILSG